MRHCHAGGDEPPKLGTSGPMPPLEEHGVICLFENSDSIVIKTSMAAMVPKLAVCLKVDIILPLHTGSVDRRCSAWDKEWW